MIKKYVYGEPFETEAVVMDIPASSDTPSHGQISTEAGFTFTCTLGKKDIVYGLGENVRGINKRGFEYISNCLDNPHHHEDARSLYAAHNFLIVDGEETFGLFLDYPSAMKFDIGYTRQDTMTITCDKADLYLYVIDGSSPYDIIKQFRKIIGRSYIAPRFAFGFGQSRWGYRTPDDFRTVAAKHRENHVPIDMVYMDIDYMDGYRDFTLNEEFGDFKAFVQEMKDQHIHLVPIIDAGVKIDHPEDEGKPGYKKYPFYEEGVEKGYFCKRADGSDFVATVWPGETHFPDVLNKEAREWFGNAYDILLSQGIDGFWNDMNEPAIFSTPETLDKAKEVLVNYIKDPKAYPFNYLGGALMSINNNPEDYKRFYHNVNGKMVNHADVHNLFGYNMTRAAGEAFERLSPDKRILMFSRSSYIGMHRYGGIWMGDNLSWWSHLLMNLKMLPSLNMIGILYTGADLGGFGADTTRDLVLRWLALGVFTPLMRNHACLGTREQEFYQFENTEDFRHVISVRYRLLPYIYSEYMKAVLRDDMMFKPLAFAYPEDAIACETEDQILLGDEVMLAPVYTQNAAGRTVYLPEAMTFVKFLPDGSISEEALEKGLHYVNIELNEVAFFIRAGKTVPVAEAAEYSDAVTTENLTMLGTDGASYELYEDDGLTRDVDLEKGLRVIRK